MSIKENRGRQDSNNFLNQFFILYLIFGFIVSLTFVLFPIEIFSLISGFNDETLLHNKDILLSSVFVFTLMIINNYLVNILTSYKYFTIPMIIGMINGVIVLTFTFLLHEQLNIISIILGQIAAYIINIAILIIIMRKNLNWSFCFVKYHIPIRIIKNLVFTQSGALVSLASSFTPIYMLTSFDAGILSSLTFGQKTSDIPIQLITTQFATVAGIKLNELYAKKEFENLNRIFLKTIKFSVFLMVPIGCLTFIYSDIIISFLFEHGLFSITAVKNSADFLKLFSITLPFITINSIVARLLMAAKRIKEGFMYQIILNLALIFCTIQGVRIFSAPGYIYAIILIQTLNFFLIYFLLKISVSFVDYKDFMIYFLKIFVANVFVALLISFLNPIIFELPIANFLFGTFLFASVLLLLSYFFDLSDDANLIIKKLAMGIKSFN